MNTFWNLNSLISFFESKKLEPGEYKRLVAEDPAGRVVASYHQAVKDFNDDTREASALGYGDVSIVLPGLRRLRTRSARP